MIERNVQWVYPLSDKAVQADVKKLMAETGLSKDEVIILYNRNIRTKEDINNFLNLSLDNMCDPHQMKDAVKVAKVIAKHINCNNKIVLYSDYDADGWGCVVVALKLLRRVGADIEWYANTREMGYGIKPEGVDEVLKKYPEAKLLVTSDNGIVGFEGIQHAIDCGLEVCVTDHHMPSSDGRLPECSGVVDPHRADETYPFDGLCGAGVIWKVCTLVYEELGIDPKKCNCMLDVVALSTIADCVPILYENRIIVTEGLRRINKESKVVWTAMREVLQDARFETCVTAKTIGFTYGPCINACSRLMGNIELPVRPFLYDNDEKNLPLMRKDIELMRDVNEERKALCNSQTDGVMTLIDAYVDDEVYVVWHPELHEGVVGIIAGRIAEKYNKPCIVLTNSKAHPTVWKGSARSVPGFNLKEVLDQIQEKSIEEGVEGGYLAAYGGHEGAAGLTVNEEHLLGFKLAMLEKGEELLSTDAIKKLVVDVVLTDENYAPEYFDRMRALEPFGEGFEMPVYGVRDFNPSEVSKFGGEEKDKHVKFIGKNVDFIAWNSQKDWIDNFGEYEGEFNAIGELRYDSYNGKMQLTTMNIIDSFSPRK